MQWDLDWELAALASLQRLAPGLDVAPLQQEARAAALALSCRRRGTPAGCWDSTQLRRDATAQAAHQRPAERTALPAIVPVRLVPGPVNLIGYLPRLSARGPRSVAAGLAGITRHDVTLLPCSAPLLGGRQAQPAGDHRCRGNGEWPALPGLLLAYFELLRKLGLVAWQVELLGGARRQCRCAFALASWPALW